GAVLEKPVEVAIAPNKLPTEPVVLTAPPTGECEVIVLGPDGKPYTDEIDVALRLLTRDEELLALPEQDEYREVRPGTTVDIDGVTDGRALFRHVQIGSTLEASAQL